MAASINNRVKLTRVHSNIIKQTLNSVIRREFRRAMLSR